MVMWGMFCYCYPHIHYWKTIRIHHSCCHETALAATKAPSGAEAVAGDVSTFGGTKKRHWNWWVSFVGEIGVDRMKMRIYIYTHTICMLLSLTIYSP